MNPFSIKSLYPYIDCFLLDKNTLKTNTYIGTKFIIEDEPLIVAKKLYESSVIFIHPDGFDDWTDILLELTQKKHLPLKLIIIAGSDTYLDFEIMEIMFAFFQYTQFWICNWMDYNEQCSLLPIGSNVKKDIIEKNYLFGISYTTNNSIAREEFIDYLADTREIQQYCLPQLPMDEYVNSLSEFYFSCCPMGNGYDTIRFWESLMLGCIPIVKRHIFYDNLLKHYPKIPILFVEDWSELPGVVENLSVEKYNEMWCDVDCLYEEFWVNLIKIKIL